LDGRIMMYVVTHKYFSLSLPSGYQKLMVGKNCLGKYMDGYIYDNQGNNISKKNSSYCEMTGLYWIWKHAINRHVGLCHYRRYFQRTAVIGFPGRPFPIEILDQYLENYDCLVAQRVYASRAEKTIYGQYCSNHYEKDLIILASTVEKSGNLYANAFGTLMRRDYFFPYNMFYSSRELMCDYCSWVFPILSECENYIDTSKYDLYQKRIYGFFAERLFNVWLLAQKKKILEVPVMQIGTSFVSRFMFYKSQKLHQFSDFLSLNSQIKCNSSEQ
jgi:hypothetical protein